MMAHILGQERKVVQEIGSGDGPESEFVIGVVPAREQVKELR